jgi:hypothetical protein
MNSEDVSFLKTMAKVFYCAFKGDTWLEDIARCTYGSERVNSAYKANKARYERSKRVRNRSKKCIEDGKAIFLTLTFNDKVLANTSVETRRRYVSRFLKSQTTLYIANIDFGKKKGREHYHAIVVAQKVDLSSWRRFGNINCRRIRTSDKDLFRTSKYLTKLTSHAIKETTGHKYRILYSRKK